MNGDLKIFLACVAIVLVGMQWLRYYYCKSIRHMRKGEKVRKRHDNYFNLNWIMRIEVEDFEMVMDHIYNNHLNYIESEDIRKEIMTGYYKKVINGQLHMQVWEFMEIFGSLYWNGNNIPGKMFSSNNVMVEADNQLYNLNKRLRRYYRWYYLSFGLIKVKF